MSTSSRSLDIHKDKKGIIFIIIYVNDLVIGDKNLADINKVKMVLPEKFKMKDMHELHYFVDI